MSDVIAIKRGWLGKDKHGGWMAKETTALYIEPSEDLVECLVVSGDLDIANQVLGLANNLKEGKVCFVLPNDATPQDAELIRDFVESLFKMRRSYE